MFSFLNQTNAQKQPWKEAKHFESQKKKVANQVRNWMISPQCQIFSNPKCHLNFIQDVFFGAAHG